MQTIMISVHIPKTGGTSFRKMLEGYYGPALLQDYAWMERHPVISGSKELAGTDEEVRSALNGVRCIHGHFDARKYARLLHMDGIKPVFVTWLRDPVERAVSAYYFLRSLNTPPDKQPEWERLAKSMTLEQFHSETRYGSNQQCVQMRDFDPSGFSFFGLTERYAASLALFSRMFFPERELPAIPHELKNEQRGGEKYDIPPATRKLVADANERDLRLYEYARGWLNGALATGAQCTE